MEHKDILNALQWRYATKKFDTTKKVSEKDFNFLLEATRLSASSFGLQPFKILVIKNPSIREELKAAAWNQPQITEASHLIVFAAKKNLGEKDVEEYLSLIAKERNVHIDTLKSFKDMLQGFVEGATPEKMTEWSKKQAYIALGTLLETAALYNIDACPMEGFDAAQFDTILNLDKDHLTAAVICTLGYRASDDEAAKQKKVRFPKDKLIIVK